MLEEVKAVKTAMDLVFNAMSKPAIPRLKTLKTRLEEIIASYIWEKFEPNNLLSIEDMIFESCQQKDLIDDIVNEVVNGVSNTDIERQVRKEWAER